MKPDLNKMFVSTQIFKEKNKEIYFWIATLIFIIWLLTKFYILIYIAGRCMLDYLAIHIWSNIGKNINIKNSVVFWEKEFEEDIK